MLMVITYILAQQLIGVGRIGIFFPLLLRFLDHIDGTESLDREKAHPDLFSIFLSKVS